MIITARSYFVICYAQGVYSWRLFKAMRVCAFFVCVGEKAYDHGNWYGVMHVYELVCVFSCVCLCVCAHKACAHGHGFKAMHDELVSVCL
jgi:hypothetical protein